MSENDPATREAALAAARQALLRKRIQGAAPSAPRGIPRRADRARAPLSYAQQRLWFVDQLSPGDPSYNVPTPLRVEGPLDPHALERALAEMVRRQEALRTVLATDPAGDAEQRVLPAPEEFRLPVEDLRAVPGDEREAELQRRLRAELRRPFDLAAGPLFRARLFRLADADHVLALTVHHVAGDGHSNHLMVRELSALYGAFSRGLPSPLPELRVQYGDFAAWQRERLRGPAFERQLAFWTEKLRGAPPLLDLPTDHARPPLTGHRAGTERLEVPAGVVDRLRALARAEGATLFNVLLAAMAAHLGRYARQEEVVVGVPVDARALPELEDVVGLFLNTLPLRVPLQGCASFRESVRRVRVETAAALAHQDVQFEKLVDELGIERSLGRTPVFQVAFSFAEGGGAEPAPPPGGTTFRPMQAGTGTVSFDLGLHAAAHPGGVSGVWSYSAELWEPETAGRMARAFEALLARVAADPELPLGELAVLPEADRARVLREWNPTELRDRGHLPVHRLVEEWAARSPEAPAVLCGGETLTYAGLDRRADRLARRLRGLGVGPETLVGICLERSAETVAAVLAVLKAGGAYLPLDPAYPADRLAYLLRDSAARVVVTRGGAARALPASGAAVLRLDEEGDDAGPVDAERIGAEVPPSALAYAIYTSGSTGRPKGVEVEHRSFAALLLGLRGELGLGPGDVVASVASYAFDIWGLEVFAPLAAGAAVRIVPAEHVAEPAALLRELADVTALHAVPALMRLVAEAARAASLPPLRHLWTGGDRVPPDLLRELREACPGAELRVLYGPTEATVLATRFRVPADGRVERHPIGTPLPHARAYVCGAGPDPVMLGVPGELWLGGAGVARGYLGRPELTAERFVPDPFSGEAGARLYRTGDLARWRPEGVLEFLGRVDAQVKVRGFRVEPGEVEAALRRVEGVADAVVATRADASGEARLVAYVVPRAGAEVGTRELRAALAEELPEHMVPSAFVALDALPLTPSGKVDARALPAPDAASAARGHVEPRTALERVLAGIWADVLGVERVGVHDNFFELGGHSILATQVANRAKVLRTAVPVRWLFQHPTVEELARAVSGAEPRPGQAEKAAAVLLRVQSLSPEARLQLLRGGAATGVEG